MSLASSSNNPILQALCNVLHTELEGWEEPQVILGSSLLYRPDAFFIAPDGKVFIVEVKKSGVTTDHIRVMIDSCLDLQDALGPAAIEIIASSPIPLSSEVMEYIERVSSFPLFPIHFVHLTSARAAHILSLSRDSPEFMRESENILSDILRGDRTS